MENSTKNILIGIVTSAFLSPFVGGGVAGYLSSTDVRKGIKIGGIVGITIAVVFSSIALLYTYFGVYQPLYAMAGGTEFESGAMQELLPHLVGTGLLFMGSIVGGLIGGGIGSYIAGHQPPNDDGHGSTS